MRRIVILLAAAAVLQPLSGQAAQEATFDFALAHYHEGRFGQAFAAFAKLADEGHCEAARIAREMTRFGRQLYPEAFELAPLRMERWPQWPNCQGPVVAKRK